MTILITGARGAVGAGLLRRLHGHDVRAASRVPDQLDVPAVELDLSRPDTFAPALVGVSSVFLYAEPAGIAELLDAAARAGVEQIVLLSSAAVAEPGGATDALAHHHLLVEQAVLGASFRTTLLRPGAFHANALGWCEPIRAGRPVEQAYPDARIAPIHAEDIVDVAELAITTDKLDGQAITLVGPESLTFHEQLAILGELLGRRIEVTELTHEQGLAQLTRYMPAPTAESLLGYWAASQSGPASTADRAERITGVPGRTFRAWATENLAAYS